MDSPDVDALAHVALRVERLREAEAYYRTLFDLSVVFCETEVDGEWRALPPDANWEDASEADPSRTSARTRRKPS